jgi:hypothetical protein
MGHRRIVDDHLFVFYVTPHFFFFFSSSQDAAAAEKKRKQDEKVGEMLLRHLVRWCKLLLVSFSFHCRTPFCSAHFNISRFLFPPRQLVQKSNNNKVAAARNKVEGQRAKPRPSQAPLPAAAADPPPEKDEGLKGTAIPAAPVYSE